MRDQSDCGKSKLKGGKAKSSKSASVMRRRWADEDSDEAQGSQLDSFVQNVGDGIGDQPEASSTRKARRSRKGTSRQQHDEATHEQNAAPHVPTAARGYTDAARQYVFDALAGAIQGDDAMVESLRDIGHSSGNDYDSNVRARIRDFEKLLQKGVLGAVRRMSAAAEGEMFFRCPRPRGLRRTAGDKGIRPFGPLFLAFEPSQAAVS